MNRDNLGASPDGDRAGGPADLSRCASQPKALVPSAGEMHEGLLKAIRLVLANDYPAARGAPSYTTAIALGLLTEETQTKPCRTCGKPRPDFTYPHVTLAGQAYYALASTMNAEGTSHARP